MTARPLSSALSNRVSWETTPRFIFEQLQDSGLLDHTLVIITNDHGEMLGANGGSIGHGWAITPELVNTPLIIMDPEKNGGQINYTIGSQIDLLPTILARLHIPVPGDQLYEGHSLDQAQAERRPWIYLNSYQQYGLVIDQQLIVGDRGAEGRRTDATRKRYALTNERTRTLFSEVSGRKMREISIKRFGEFQENLLRNYSFYCQSIRKIEPAQVQAKSE